MRMKVFRLSAVFLSAFLALSLHAQAPTAPSSASVTLFQHVRVLSKAGQLSASHDVLVRGNVIERISVSPIPADRSMNMKIIEGGGRTLMPGLIDDHWHALMLAPMPVMMSADYGYLYLLAGQEAGNTLLRGFTSVRDMAGPTFGLKRAIDGGIIPGPRIWPSGAMISQTSGHGDFRLPYEIPQQSNSSLGLAEKYGVAMLADGVPQMLMRVREQLMQGASQIKVAAGGGVASNYDPLDVAEYTEEEIHAAVLAANDWGTYVTVHAYTPLAIQTAIRAGVKCIEHGQLMDEATAKMMAEHGVWLSTQPFIDDQDANPYSEGSVNRAKQVTMFKGTENAYALAKKYKLNTAWGTDILNEPKLAPRQGAMLTKMVRWYTPAEVLKMATADNAELLAMSGPRNPYPGKLGVVEEGALADLLLVDGDPVTNIKLMEDPGKNFLVIMKDGKIYKNTISGSISQ